MNTSKRTKLLGAAGLTVACLLFGYGVAGVARAAMDDGRPQPRSQSDQPAAKNENDARPRRAGVQQPPPPLADPYHAPGPPRRVDDGLERRTVPQPAD